MFWSKKDAARALLLAALAVVTALVVVGSAKSAPPRVQLAQRVLNHDSRIGRTQHVRVFSVRCRLMGASRPHVYFCEERFQYAGAPRDCNVAAYHFYRGQLEHWPTAWPCGTRPPYIPPFPGDVGIEGRNRTGAA